MLGSWHVHPFWTDPVRNLYQPPREVDAELDQVDDTLEQVSVAIGEIKVQVTQRQINVALLLVAAYPLMPYHTAALVHR